MYAYGIFAQDFLSQVFSSRRQFKLWAESKAWWNNRWNQTDFTQGGRPWISDGMCIGFA
jgi:hypothetical protein